MENFEEILEQAIKPGRYLGNEWNVVKKNFSESSVRVALCFPDVYEVGMSHLGLRIIYGLLNSMDGVVCERVFCPWPDFSSVLLKRDLPLFSLESRIPLKKFDIIAFSLAYELDYTNILEILKLARIPLKAEERGEDFPLIIGGGPCTLNPEPLSNFFDLFIIGDGEEAIAEFTELFQNIKSGGMVNKSKLLLELSKIEGVYVPSFYKVKYNNDGTIDEFTTLKEEAPSTINKRTVRNLDESFYPTKYVVPYISVIHDRVIIEVMRGCSHKCRFCQASACYRPLRIRSEEKILSLIKESFKNTGYEDFSLMSLSSGDYPKLTNLIKELSNTDIFKDKGASISLSSLRIEDILSELPELIRKIKKRGFTFAPEAGSERLRKVIAKDIDMAKLLKAVETAQREGWRRVKLYFMIGLPTEEPKDIDGILTLLKDVENLTNKRFFEIAVSISSFIPKPHTPFQWEKMDSINELFEKQQYIQKNTRSRRTKLNFHNSEVSFLEAVISRGDRNLGNVILTAFENGARFDSWNEFFDFKRWLYAFEKEGIDPKFYIKGKGFDETLPWDHINAGVAKNWMIEEAIKARGVH